MSAVGYTRKAEAIAAAPAVEAVPATASVLGIPEEEFTPRVRDAIMTLMGEVESLRRELQQTRSRLDEVEKSADRDHLLPILNRRAFVRELTRYISFAARYGTPASLVYFDLDGFKAVNDTHGHAAGDAVLGHFAEILLGHIRDSDVVGRLGGDEFGVILSHANSNQAHKKADVLVETLKGSPALWRGQKIAVHFSYGAFELMAGEDADGAIARADEAMYANKRNGR
ncbi:MAG: GGDEF domain-containing protein [Proteobacteria bacterium]|nr:GGDEF domain-containing protein [Pseudomonadota bacterium]